MHGDMPKYIAEFVGTFMLVFTIGCNLLSMVHTWAVVSIASSLMVGIYALSSVSGAHFNPAVTLAAAMNNKIAWKQAGMYMLVQILGAIIAAFSYTILFNESVSISPGTGFYRRDALITEALYTFMLAFVVLNVAYAEGTRGNQYYGLAIGYVLVAGGYAAGGISGGAFNPAVVIGLEASDMWFSSRHDSAYGLSWCLCELLGGALAATVFRWVRPEDFGSMKTPTTKLIAEFVGTYFLVLTVGLNVITSGKGPAFSIAASLMCMVYALGDVSGGHFNPAVTFAVWRCKRGIITGNDACLYASTQLVGAFMAGFHYSWLTNMAFALAPGVNFSWLSAGVAEILFTALLCFVVLAVTTTQQPQKEMFGLAIGMCVAVGGYAVGPISGATLNPAVSFAIDSANALRGGTWMNCLAYTLFELIGAFLASCAFSLTHPSEFPKTNPRLQVL